MGYMTDTAQSWALRDDGSYARIAGGGKPVQIKLLEQLTGAEETLTSKAAARALKPRVAKTQTRKKK